jgi:hypothetical protein
MFILLKYGQKAKKIIPLARADYKTCLGRIFHDPQRFRDKAERSEAADENAKKK